MKIKPIKITPELKALMDKVREAHEQLSDLEEAIRATHIVHHFARIQARDLSKQMADLAKAQNPAAFAECGTEFAIALHISKDEATLVLCEDGERAHSPEFAEKLSELQGQKIEQSGVGPAILDPDEPAPTVH